MAEKTTTLNLTEEEFVHPGNRACSGCGLSIVYRMGLKALGKYTILVVLDNPKGLTYGGETAAPAFQEIAKKIISYKGLKPDSGMTQAEKDQAPGRPITD